MAPRLLMMTTTKAYKYQVTMCTSETNALL